MLRVLALVVLAGSLTACGGDISFPPPPQRNLISHSVSHPISAVLGMSADEGDMPWASILGDILPPSEGADWRWTREHPSVQFDLMDSDGWKATARITAVDKVLATTGPQHVAMLVNGSRVGSATLSATGNYTLSFPVDPTLLKSGSPAVLSLDIEPCSEDPSRSEKGRGLCVLLHSIGFRKEAGQAP
ncbi:MAG: hypothetical protein ABJC09_06590 [Terriglobia bacterium]